MTTLISLPGGGEWIFIIFLFLFLLVFPVLAVIHLIRGRELKRENETLKNTNQQLLDIIAAKKI